MKIKGVLLSDFGKTYFRVYSKDGEFIDYDIKADDISIEIDDPSVELKTNSTGENYIDYTDQVLWGK